ncbi:MAG: 2-C-methyl-D-erythritol 4-phosphate cytidylyltransferase [Elusimicrobia bacterium]|nr:2-C-methyl-D-erythritol 4-phosphate cytidylyltransferase [Elusimicrobiota bacterium]
MNNPNNAAIIVAAGAGTRLGAATPKQFLKLNGLPVFLWSVRAFQKTRLFSQIIVVVPSVFVRRLTPLAQRNNFTLIAGGRERHDSVKAGLKGLNDSIHYVAIHDGARPLVTPEIITRGIAAAQRHGASVIAVPARDTVKLSTKKSIVSKTIPRSSVWLAQTPQTFKRSVIERAYARRPATVTDDAQVVESTGVKVIIVPGDYCNIKITDRRDFSIARLFIKK